MYFDLPMKWNNYFVRPVDKIHFGLKKRNEESRDCYFNANVYFDKLPYVYIDIV